MRDDGFLLHVTPDMVALVGANDRGTVYAAYELIERLGARWYWPGPENEYLPDVGDLVLSVGTDVINPSFRFRLLCAMFGGMKGIDWDPRTTWQMFPSPRKEHMFDWGVKNRLNTGFAFVMGDEVTAEHFARRGGVAGRLAGGAGTGGAAAPRLDVAARLKQSDVRSRLRP